ncbi:stealth family protein [Enterococcus sp. LJL120]
MEKIDFIVTWVDSNDKIWLKKKEKYSRGYQKSINTESRYRDWDFLKYWFRSVEKNSPWVNKVYFVTEGHLPEWLNIDYDKLQVVKHIDFIDSEFLPTFNSNVIELNFGNIESLSEYFVSFNDDMIINAPVKKTDFFKKNLPRDFGIFSPIIPKINSIDSIVLNNVEIINEYFSKNDVILKNFTKFFNIKYGKQLTKNFLTIPWSRILGFYDDHIPISYKKSTYKEVLELENKKVIETSKNKFRTKSDISHWLVRYWQICKGEFVPRTSNFGKYYNLEVELPEVLKDISSGEHKIICLNDNDSILDFEKTKSLILKELSNKYYEKCGFEK